MAIFGRRRSANWETFALLDYGDHGLGAARQNPERVGVIEVSDTLRWAPQAGDGWEVPIDSITVHTPVTFFNRPPQGVEVWQPALGLFRIRPLGHEPGEAHEPGKGSYQGERRQAGRLLKLLLRQDATHAPPV